jgi:hypothetical protein
MVGKFRNRIKGHFANEVAIVTPNGKLLSAYPEEALKKWKELPESERKTLEDLGKYDAALDPTPPPGGLILKVYTRPLSRGADKSLAIYRNTQARDQHSQEVGRDYLWLTEAEWKGLIPSDAKPGDTLAVPETVVHRICKHYLLDVVRIGGNGNTRDTPLAQQFRMTVEEATAANLRLRLDASARYRVAAGHDNLGTAKKAREDTFTLLGYLEFDKQKNACTRFDIVALSETGHYNEKSQKVLPLGIAFELTRGDQPADRIRPASYSKDYFAPLSDASKKRAPSAP